MNGGLSLFAGLSEWSGFALERAIYAGVCAALLVPLVVVINLFFRRWLSARQMGLLWGIVLLRLVIPVAPSSVFSLQNLLGQYGQTAPVLIDLTQASDASSIADELSANGIDPETVNVNFNFNPSDYAAASAKEETDLLDRVESQLPLIWLLGGVATLLWTLIVHARFCGRLRLASAAEDPRLNTLWDECRVKTRVRRQIRILLFDGVEQPAVLGLFRPKLLLPSSALALNDQQLRLVMLHELAHVRRWHLAANWGLVFLRAVHWWNPVYWLAARRFQSLREQACDAFAIRESDGQSVRDYSELLLLLAQRPNLKPAWRVMLPASILGFLSSFFRTRAVRNRLKALRFAGITHGRWHAAAVVGLVGLVGLCGLTDASSPETPKTPSERSQPRVGSVTFERDWKTEPMVTRTYNAAKALSRIAAVEPEVNARTSLYWVLVDILKGTVGRSPELADDRQWEKDHLTLQGDGRTFTVTAPLRVHAEIAKNLAAWEQSGLAQISTRPRLITDDRDLTSLIGISWSRVEAFPPVFEAAFAPELKGGLPNVPTQAAAGDFFPIALAILSDEQTHALLNCAEKNNSSNVVQCPVPTTFNGEQVSLSSVTRRPVVLATHNEGEGTVQQSIAFVDEGTKLAWRAIESRDFRKIQLEGQFETSEPGDVRTVPTPPGGESKPIQMPRAKWRRIDFSSEVQDGHSLLISCLPTNEQKGFLYVLLTVRRVWPPAESK